MMAALVAAVAAIVWWVAYVGTGAWTYLFAALACTLSWALFTIRSVGGASRRVDQMIDPKSEDPES